MINKNLWISAWLWALCIEMSLAQPADLASRYAVSTVSAGVISSSAGGNSSAPLISEDGRFVLFTSDAMNLVANDDNLTTDIFLADRKTRQVRLVSVNTNGFAGGGSSASQMDRTAEWVVFQSYASDLAMNDTNGVTDVFVRNMTTGQTWLVSVDLNGTTPGNGESRSPQISGDGRFVAFESVATNLVTDDTNKYADVFVRDVQQSTTYLVSVNREGTGGANNASESPSLSLDGRRVAYQSLATNLVANDTNSTLDVFVGDWPSGTNRLVSVRPDGLSSGNRPSRNPMINADGRYVVFQSDASNLVPNDTNGFTDIFLRDLDMGTTIPVSFHTDPVQELQGHCVNPVISPDGRWIAFECLNILYLWDAQSRLCTLISVGGDGAESGNGTSHSPQISEDGQRIAFVSDATNLVPGVSNSVPQIYLRNLKTGITTLVSVTRTGTGNRRYADFPAMTPDGSCVAYSSLDNDLVADDQNSAEDVFVWDAMSGATELISTHAPGNESTTAAGASMMGHHSMSADGRWMVFVNNASDLTPNGAGSEAKVFARDLWTGKIELVSVNTNGEASSLGPSLSPVISANGRYVAFMSAASDLTPNDTNGTYDIFVRDLELGTTILASTNPLEDGPFGPFLYPAISGDGRHLAFLASDTNGTALYICDLLAQTQNQVIVNLTNRYVYPVAPLLSADGRFLVFRMSGQLWARDLIGQQDFQLSQSCDYVDPAGIRLLANGRYWLAYTRPYSSSVYISDLQLKTIVVTIQNGYRPCLSTDGNWVAFEQRSGTLYTNVYVQNLSTKTKQLVSVKDRGKVEGNNNSTRPLISPNGRFVAFTSEASDLVPGDFNQAADLFVRDMVRSNTQAISLNLLTGTTANRPSIGLVMSSDGRTLVFGSYASGLVPGDYNNQKDLFVLRLSSGDSDGDGMDDDWESTYFGNLIRDGTGDYDGDGVSDGAEFTAGTDPTNQGSVFKAMTVTPLAGGPTLVLWSAIPGKTYRVQYTDTLTEVSWRDLPGDVIAENVTASKVDPTTAGNGQRYYRVLLVEPGD
jgi:Tol biopolymer transport system component